MNIKKGDRVRIIAGKDRDKTGKVLQVFISRSKASIEGLNLSIKHLRPRKQGEQGQRIEFPAPMNLSNMMVVCEKCGKPTRVGVKILAQDGSKKGKKYRVCKKCNQTID
jgi:large subunit ribosomal protein L24